MSVTSKSGPASSGQGVFVPVNSRLQTAVTFYHANRQTPVPRLYRSKDNKGKKVTNYGYSIRRVATMHGVAYSLLQRAITSGGKIKTRSQAHEKEMVLTVEEEKVLEEWCLQNMHGWGYQIRLDLLRNMACAIVEERERRNSESASDFRLRMLDHLNDDVGPNLDLIGKNWYKRFLSRHPAISAMHSGIDPFNPNAAVPKNPPDLRRNQNRIDTHASDESSSTANPTDLTMAATPPPTTPPRRTPRSDISRPTTPRNAIEVQQHVEALLEWLDSSERQWIELAESGIRERVQQLAKSACMSMSRLEALKIETNRQLRLFQRDGGNPSDEETGPDYQAELTDCRVLTIGEAKLLRRRAEEKWEAKQQRLDEKRQANALERAMIELDGPDYKTVLTDKPVLTFGEVNCLRRRAEELWEADI